MTMETKVLVIDEACLTIDELAQSCTVSREWIIEHVHAGVLHAGEETDPARWLFNGGDLRRARKIFDVERRFDANPELAGLVADLLEELAALKVRARQRRF